MPISNADIAALPSYTDAELLKLVRSAISEILVGGHSIGLNGKQLTRVDLKNLRDAEKDLQARITTQTAGGDLIAAAVFGG